MADAVATPRRVLTEDDIALLGQAVFADEGQDSARQPDEQGYAALVGFHERLVLGDLSW